MILKKLIMFTLNSLLVILLLISKISAVYAQQNWLTIKPGLEYLDLNSESITPWSHIHIFRIDLKYYTLDLVDAKAQNQTLIPIKTLSQMHNALIGINGGFFDEHNNPLGLRISNKKILNPLKKISWWGVFYIINNQPAIVSMSNYTYSPNINTAIQSGPRLLINHHKPSLKAGLAARSALGITENNQLIMLVTENTPMTTSKLADLMLSIGCRDAINLDGGSSSQLYAHINKFHLDVKGFANIHDGLIIKNVS